jgi:hypothetical protein
LTMLKICFLKRLKLQFLKNLFNKKLQNRQSDF